MTERKKLGKVNGEEYEPPRRKTVIVPTKPRRVKVNVHNNKRMFESYDPAVHPAKALQMVANGATEREVRSSLGITGPVFDMWRARYPEFASALVIGKDASLADARVERSLFEMANGYEQPAVKIMMHEGEPVVVEYVEQVQKNVTAAKLWLANRDPSNWGRNPEQSQSALSPSVLNVKMIQGMDAGQLRAVIQLLKQTLAPMQAQGLKRLDAIDITPEPVKEPA